MLCSLSSACMASTDVDSISTKGRNDVPLMSDHWSFPSALAYQKQVNGGATCGVTLVWPTASVTSAHCVVGHVPEYIRLPNGFRVVVRDVHVMPDYWVYALDPELYDYAIAADVAVIEHAEVHSIKPARIVAVAQKGENKLRAVVYGFDQSGEYSSTRQIAKLDLTRVINLRGYERPRFNVDYLSTKVRSPTLDICSVDSGSAVFLNALPQNQLVGMVSHISGWRTVGSGSAQASCAKEAMVTYLGARNTLEFINGYRKGTTR